MGPWAALIGLLCAAAVAAWAGWTGYGLGRDSAIAEAARDEAVAKIASDAAQDAIAKGLSQLKVVNRTIVNEVQRDVIEKPVYRDIACRHDADSMRRINAALTGSTDAEALGGIRVPAPDATDRPQFRGDDAQAGGGGNPVPPVPASGAGPARP